ncbi:hypothetical protein CTI12_AA233030 [Artemisia annua]|uniref:Uncharacterized protein n=1 Tax=Artemisia annua TaxID=35608 RepID=A0A2U1MLM0_ARTAN|nr:hypothetical protein CTI12_AA233030 [Artemisia annua]
MDPLTPNRVAFSGLAGVASRNGYYKQEYRKKVGPNNKEKQTVTENQNNRKENNGVQSNKGKENNNMQSTRGKENNATQSNTGNRYEALNILIEEDGRQKEQDDVNGNKEDVYENRDGIAQTMVANIVNGKSAMDPLTPNRVAFSGLAGVASRSLVQDMFNFRLRNLFESN